MKKILKFFQPKRCLIKQAEKLVAVANIHAISSLVSTLKHAPILEKGNLKHWDMIITVAGVFVGTTSLNKLNLETSFKEKIWNIIIDDLHKINPFWTKALQDCSDFFERTHVEFSKGHPEPKFLASDIIGLWIILNLFENKSEDKEVKKLTRVLGGMNSVAFSDWWET